MALERDEGEALVEAMKMGLLAVSEVVAWADARIVAGEVPSGPLCDVSLASNRDDRALIDLLRELPGRADRAVVELLVIDLVASLLRADVIHIERAVECLYLMALAGRIADPELSRVVRWADDAFDLAAMGYVGDSREEVVATVEGALDRVSERGVRRWSSEPSTWRAGRTDA